jgi:PadR family transcriptional regulator AphA
MAEVARGAGPRAARESVKLSLAEHLVLALLAGGATHGFAVARLLEREAVLGRVYHVSRPLVYRAVERLGHLRLVRAGRLEAGSRGPRRTPLAVTATGRSVSETWLHSPVEHVRDIRTELMVKLALLERSGQDASPLLKAQRQMLEPILAALARQCEAGDGFDRTLAVWRYQTALAAMQVLDQLLR